jgi:lipid-A-disaccharide synthase
LFSNVKWDSPEPVVVLARTDDVLAVSDVVVTASGTATVQAALHRRPMVVVYQLSPLSYRLGRRFVHVDDVAMVNLIAGRRIVPELIQEECTPRRIATETLSLLTDSQRAQQMREALEEVCGKLGGPGASGRAAEAVLEVVRSRSSS